jgi:hypothetical protein
MWCGLRFADCKWHLKVLCGAWNNTVAQLVMQIHNSTSIFGRISQQQDRRAGMGQRRVATTRVNATVVLAALQVYHAAGQGQHRMISINKPASIQ